MSDISAKHPLEQELGMKSHAELEQLRREIVDSAKGEFESLDDNALERLAFIVAVLRRRTAGPPKVAAVARSKSQKPTIDDLIL